MSSYGYPPYGLNHGQNAYTYDNYDDYLEYLDFHEYTEYNRDPENIQQQQPQQDFEVEQQQPQQDQYQQEGYPTQYASYPAHGLPASLSSPAAISEFLVNDPFSYSRTNSYDSISSKPPVPHKDKCHAYSQSTGNIDVVVPDRQLPRLLPSQFNASNRSQPNGPPYEMQIPKLSTPPPPFQEISNSSSPERPSHHPLGPREPPLHFSESPRRRNDTPPTHHSSGRITYRDLNKDLPVLDTDDYLPTSDPFEQLHSSNRSSFSALSGGSSNTSHELEKTASRLPSTPPQHVDTTRSSPSKPVPAELSPLHNYACGHAALDPRYKSSLNLPAQVVTFGGELPKPPVPPKDTYDTVSTTSSSDTLMPFPKRIQRSKTYTEASDDLLLPPPTRSYSTVSKSFAGSYSVNSSFRSVSAASSNLGEDEDASLMLRLNLPAIPDSRSQLDPSKLSSRDFELCEEPWMVSSICRWILHLNSWAEMSYDTISEAIIGLFRHTIPTLGWVAAERVTIPLLESLINSKFLTIDQSSGSLTVHEKNSTTGVLTSITGKGCYSPKNHKTIDILATSANKNSLILKHEEESGPVSSYHCYSSRCCRSIPYKTVLPGLKHALKVNDSDRVNWAKIWSLTDDDLSKLDKKVIERQCAIQEFIGTEEIYVRGLKAFLNVFGDHLAKTKPHIVSNQANFWSNTFGCISGLIKSNDNMLLSHLKIRQTQQGPYISEIADVVLNWLKSASKPYMSRASTYSHAMRIVSSEKGRNDLFNAWLDRAERDPRLNRHQKFDFLIASPFTRLCRYNLLFERICAATPKNDPEYQLWRRCIDECKSLVSEYNRISGEAEDISSIMALEERIVFPKPEEKVDLRLWESRRKIYYEGDVVRRGEYGIDYVDTHMILLDHYLILAKVKKDNLENYIVSKRPIALDLLVVEQADGEPVTKSNAKMITGVLSGNSETRRLSKIYNNTLPNSLRGHSSQTSHSNGSTSGPGSRLNSVVGLTSLNPKEAGGSNGSNLNGLGSNSTTSFLNGTTIYTNTNDTNENIVYPIKLRDLGSDPSRKAYYIYTQTEEERKTWVNKILLAKREYASMAFALNSEPFKVRVIEDRFFGYDPSEAPRLPVYSQATAVDRGIKEYESMNGPVGVTATATLGVNGTIGGGTASSMMSSFGFPSMSSSSHNNPDSNGISTTTKTSMAMMKAQTLSTVNCMVTCNVGGRFFLVAGLENGIYACDMTMRRMSTSAAFDKLKKEFKNKKKDSRNISRSPDKLPVRLPYNPNANENISPTDENVPGTEQDEYFEGDDSDMTAWAAPKWVRCLDLTKVTQLEILTEYNVLLVLADKTLAWYHLDQVLSIVQNQNRKSRNPSLTGYAISRSREVLFFGTGYMTTGLSVCNHPSAAAASGSHTGYGHNFMNGIEEKCRELLFFRKKDVKETLKRSSTIEIVEPIKEKGSQKRRSQFTVSNSAMTKKSMSRNHYGFSSTPGYHHHNSHHKTSHSVSGTLNGTFNSTMDGLYNNSALIKKGLKVSEDLICASTKSKINLGATSTEYFRDYDNITLPSDSFGITLFSSSFFVHTARGFELLSLQYKHTRTVPDPASIATALSRGGIIANSDLTSARSHHSGKSSTSTSPTRKPYSSETSSMISGALAVELFKRKLEASKPVGAFMLSDNTILLVYDQIAIFVDKFGKMSLPIVINMLSKIKSAVVSYPYLIAVSDEMVEIRRLDLNVKKMVANAAAYELSNSLTAEMPMTMDKRHSFDIPSGINKMPLQPVNGNIGQMTTKKSTKMTSRFGKKSSTQLAQKNAKMNSHSIMSAKQKSSGHKSSVSLGGGSSSKSSFSSSPSSPSSSYSSSHSSFVSSVSPCPLKQVITGKNIRLVVANTRRSNKIDQEIMIAMAHPKYPGRQLLLELIMNEFVCDDESSSLAGL